MEYLKTKEQIRSEMRRLRRGLSPDEKARAAKSICDRIVNLVGCDQPFSACPHAQHDPFCACPHAQHDSFCACPHAQHDEAKELSDSASEADAQRKASIAVYLASPDEIDLTPAIESLLARGHAVVAPRWNGSTYDLARLASLSPNDLRVGPMDIREPRDPDLVSPSDVTLWLVPGLAFTRDGARLGYGGGWYDRLLANASPTARKLGVAYDFQIVESLPVEPHDIRLDGVV